MSGCGCKLCEDWVNVLQERVLELEYVKVVAPRKQEEPCPHDDWVSAVDGSNPRYGLCLVACAQPDICGNNLSGLECLFPLLFVIICELSV